MNTITKNKMIRKYVPSAETIAEVYAEDEAMILQVTQELECDRDELIFTSTEVRQLMQYIDSDIPIKFTMMDFTNTTFENELCKLNNEY